MDNSTQITEEVKNKTYSDITEIVLRSLENGSLSAEDAHDASEYILGRLDSLPNQSYLEAFLEEIAERWPCFKPLLFAQEEKTEEDKTQQDIQNIQEEIKQII